MRRIHTVLLASLLTFPLTALAQQAPRIEQQMTAEDFMAAGLNKLSAEELARLNQWLARRPAGAALPSPAPAAAAVTTDAELQARLAQAREEGRREAAGGAQAAPAASREPVESHIVGAFNGFARGREYTLANGQVWRQVDSATLSGARGNDIGARIRPGMMGAWWLKVDGYNTQAKVEQVR